MAVKNYCVIYYNFRHTFVPYSEQLREPILTTPAAVPFHRSGGRMGTFAVAECVSDVVSPFCRGCRDGWSC